VKTQAVLWSLLAVFYIVIGTLYIVVGGDAAGATLLLIATGLGGLIGGWAWGWQRQHPTPRAQDLPDTDAADEIGVVGVYPTASLRPLALAAGICAIVLGVPLGSWMSMAGVTIVASQVALLVRDADR
jgi:hypothetical protein